VKITAAHDFNDFEVYKRHPEAGIPVINLMNEDATMSDACPPDYRGLTREEARLKVVADFDALGLLDKVEPHRHQVPYGDRSGVVIEPYLTDQWYVNAAELAKPAIEAVRNGDARFVPKTWEKTYFNWMENIQPWCVSRQLWWGHQIPAWYTPEGVCVVAESEAEAQAAAGPNVNLTRDEDVLDTWFSSALWPFATLGWPEETPDLARHYPGDVLVTGFDIIFFWVARMMMQGLHFKGEVPFHTVYCHGLVRDAKGQKMSKSKGNSVDPLILIDKFGADALRFTLTAMESQGRDIKLDEKRVEGYRNFATKLWNAVRFAQSQGITASNSPAPPEASLSVNRWIITETAQMAADAEAALTAFRFDQYADTLYQFVWSRFCDWYLELIKPMLADEGPAAAETRTTAGWAIDQILVCLHPVMPFITEELWHAQGSRTTDLIHARWPALTPSADDASAEIAWLIDLVSAIRSARTELNVPPGAKLPLHAPESSADLQARLVRHQPALERMARVEATAFSAAPAGGLAQIVVDGQTYALPLKGVIDLAAERARLLKGAEQAAKEASALAGRLDSPGFVERAKPEAIDKAREDFAARTAEAQRLTAALARLG
jgi:valyl-tRNA synthetase